MSHILKNTNKTFIQNELIIKSYFKIKNIFPLKIQIFFMNRVIHEKNGKKTFFTLKNHICVYILVKIKKENIQKKSENFNEGESSEKSTDSSF